LISEDNAKTTFKIVNHNLKQQIGVSTSDRRKIIEFKTKTGTKSKRTFREQN